MVPNVNTTQVQGQTGSLGRGGDDPGRGAAGVSAAVLGHVERCAVGT
jgi:hypothetical protein